MLKPAYPYKDALNKAYAQIAADPKYVYYHMANYLSFEIEVKPDTWDREQYVSLSYSGEVIGYLSASINRSSQSVTSLALINFSDNPIFGLDLLTFLRSLRKYRKISWMVCVGNPAEKGYDRICRIIGGRVVGVCKKDVRLVNGKLCDVKIYEWLNPNYRDDSP